MDQETGGSLRRVPGTVPVRGILFVFLLAFGLYANSIPGAFTFDDHTLKNPLVRQHQLESVWQKGYWGEGRIARAYRPVTVTTFALQSAAHGLRPFAFHLLNVLLHAFASCLVVWLAARLGSQPAGALVGGILFAVHPIHADAVASIVGRAELLAAIGFTACSLEPIPNPNAMQ